jgi:hypothetical protein
MFIIRGGGGRDGESLLCREVKKQAHLLLKCAKTQRRRQELLNKKWPNVNEKIALTGDKTTEMTNLSILACDI